MAETLPTTVVAIDGSSGSGKSTVARAVALRHGLRYLDTGATYRAVALKVVRSNISLNDLEAVGLCAADIVWDITAEPESFAVVIDGQDAEPAIRSEEITAAVSAVAAVPEVRRLMVALARAVIGTGDIVVEGRDIATVVAPQAAVKVHMVADPLVRATRRAVEQGRTGEELKVSAELQARDHQDSTRSSDPLAIASDALVIDSSNRSIAELVDQISTLVTDNFSLSH